MQCGFFESFLPRVEVFLYFCKTFVLSTVFMTAENIKTRSSSQIFSEYLHSTGRRHTPERFMVLECAEACNGHFSAEELCHLLENSGKRVATATVYSTLQLLADCGLIQPHRFNDGATLYEFMLSSHLHLVCSSCGKIKEVRDPQLEAVLAGRKFRAFSPAYFSLTVVGMCGACARKAKSEPKIKKITKPISYPSKKQ